MMAYFEKVGENTSQAKTDGILDSPVMNLDTWLQKHKAEERSPQH